MNGGNQEWVWILMGGVAGVILMYLLRSQPTATAYVPPYIPFGAQTGNPCPPGWSSGWGGQPCSCPPGTLC